MVKIALSLLLGNVDDDCAFLIVDGGEKVDSTLESSQFDSLINGKLGEASLFAFSKTMDLPVFHSCLCNQLLQSYYCFLSQQTGLSHHQCGKQPVTWLKHIKMYIILVR